MMMTFIASAQVLRVMSFRLAQNDISAVKYQRLDLNGQPCALIKVGLGVQGAKFPGTEVVGGVKFDTGEYWVYVVDGTKRLKVMHNDYTPLYIDFTNYPEQRLEGGRTYILLLDGAKSDGGNGASSQQSQSNFLIMSVTPPNASVTIDDVRETLNTDGTLKKLISNGIHRYSIDAGSAYSPVTGTIEMKGERINLPITLKSVKASLSVKTTTSGSKIYINEDYKGTDSWQGKLTPGTYLVEARKEGYRSVSKTVTLAKQQTETITLPALQQISGSLMVDFEPVDADVYLDNTLLGKTPNVFTNITTGKHIIKISKAGYADYTGSVTIRENQQASVSGSLSKSSGVASASHMQANISSANTINGHEWVDLGLSVKWATCNVGASSPSDYGDYFAWGEISTKSSYTEDNSKTYNKPMGDIAGNSQYDTASANWGSTWRMPTEKEFQELSDQCTWTWTSQGGHAGYRVTSKTNGNSIFLPAAGYRDGQSLHYVGSYGHYWSAGPNSITSGRNLSFIPSYVYPQYTSSRAYGLTVRPVSE